MSGFSFSNTQEKESTFKQSTRCGTGIHNFVVQEVEKVTVKGKDDKPDWEKIVVTLECTKTLEGTDSVGKTIPYEITMPSSQAAFDFTSASQLHIFSKTTTKEKVEGLKESIQKVTVNSIDDYFKLFNKFKGKGFRAVITGNSVEEPKGSKNWVYEGKFSTVPMFAGSVAETLDTLPSTLYYDEAKHGLRKQPKNAENAKVGFESSPVTAESDLDQLPF